jgi:hypothetical protein
MEPQAVPSRILNPEPLSTDRREVLTSDTFWSLMDRWRVPPDRALRLIGYAGQRDCSAGAERPGFTLSDQQAKVLSCLLEIDLTLTVAGVREDRLHRRDASCGMIGGSSPLDALGECNPTQAAAILWFMNRTARRKPLVR